MLHHGQQALSSERQCTEHRNRLGDAFRLLGELIGKHRDEHHAQSLHAVTGGLTDELIAALCYAQWEIGRLIDPAVGGLTTIDEDIPNTTESFLKAFDNLGGFAGYVPAVSEFSNTGNPHNAPIDQAKATKCHKRNGGLHSQQ